MVLRQETFHGQNRNEQGFAGARDEEKPQPPLLSGHCRVPRKEGKSSKVESGSRACQCVTAQRGGQGGLFTTVRRT